MRYRVVLLTGVLAATLQARVFVDAAEHSLPMKDGRPIVATVNEDSISLDELVLELDPAVDHSRLRQGYGTAGELELLDRLVNVKLIVQESAAMGLRDQPEIRKQVEVSSRAILRDVLLERIVKDVTPDPAAVEKKFKELARESKTASLLFQDKEAAARARGELVGGATFADVASRAAAAKTARVDRDDQYHARKDYLPPVADAIASVDIGGVTPVVPIQAGFVVVTVIDIRYPENAELRAEARKQVLTARQAAVLQAHDDALRRDLVTLHKDVLDGVRYDAETPGMDALLKDTRVLADIKGASSVTVGDLSEYLKLQQFHGPDLAGQRKRMNEMKAEALDAMIGRRLLNAEAKSLGLDKTTEYTDRVNALEASLVFNSFIQKVIVPDSKLTEDEVRRYYAEHLKNYSSPEMVRLRSLAFTGRAAAEEAMAKLQGGADFGWLVANADGQADKTMDGLLAFDGHPITTDSMPKGVQESITGAKAGESRLYGDGNGPFYVLAVQEVIAPTPKAYDEVREDIAKIVYGEKVRKNAEEYLSKLRTASHVEIHLVRAQ